jgi:hypothetical protein
MEAWKFRFLSTSFGGSLTHQKLTFGIKEQKCIINCVKHKKVSKSNV